MPCPYLTEPPAGYSPVRPEQHDENQLRREVTTSNLGKTSQWPPTNPACWGMKPCYGRTCSRGREITAAHRLCQQQRVGHCGQPPADATLLSGLVFTRALLDWRSTCLTGHPFLQMPLKDFASCCDLWPTQAGPIAPLPEHPSHGVQSVNTTLDASF